MMIMMMMKRMNHQKRRKNQKKQGKIVMIMIVKKEKRMIHRMMMIMMTLMMEIEINQNQKVEEKEMNQKHQKKDYKIFFSVNIQTDENDEDIIGNTKGLRPLLADLFETRKEKDVFQIKTRKKGNGFKIDFGIIIATSMHPADYIDTFDDLT